MEECIFFERIYKMILGEIEITEENLVINTSKDLKKLNKQKINIKIKKLINNAVLNFGFGGFLIKLNELFVKLNGIRGNTADVFRYEILEFKTLVESYFKPELYTKLLFLLAKDELAKEDVAKTVNTNLCQENLLLGMVSPTMLDELEEIRSAARYREDIRNECFSRVNHLMDKNSVNNKILKIEMFLTEINNPLAKIYIDIIDKINEELIKYINEEIGKHEDNELQLVLPGFYN